MNLHRRGFLTGLGASLVAAPAIVRAASLMQIRPSPTFVLRTSIPTSTWRALNTGIPYGRSPAMDAMRALRLIAIDDWERLMVVDARHRRSVA